MAVEGRYGSVSWWVWLQLGVFVCSLRRLLLSSLLLLKLLLVLVLGEMVVVG